MTATGSMLVMNLNVDLFANSTSHVELNTARIPHQIRGHMNLHPVLANDSIGRKVLALQMHVDRHVMFGATSTDRWDEVDRCDAAASLYQCKCIRGDEQFHGVSSQAIGTRRWMSPIRPTPLIDTEIASSARTQSGRSASSHAPRISSGCAAAQSLAARLTGSPM